MKRAEKLFSKLLAITGVSLLVSPTPAFALAAWERLSFERIVEGITRGAETLIKLGALVATGVLVYGGIQYMISGGDKQSLEIAKKTITYSIVGLLFIFGAYLIVNTICKQLGVDCGI